MIKYLIYLIISVSLLNRYSKRNYNNSKIKRKYYWAVVIIYIMIILNILYKLGEIIKWDY